MGGTVVFVVRGAWESHLLNGAWRGVSFVSGSSFSRKGTPLIINFSPEFELPSVSSAGRALLECKCQDTGFSQKPFPAHRADGQ